MSPPSLTRVLNLSGQKVLASSSGRLEVSLFRLVQQLGREAALLRNLAHLCQASEVPWEGGGEALLFPSCDYVQANGDQPNMPSTYVLLIFKSEFCY